jgi:hypothetical protein
MSCSLKSGEIGIGFHHIPPRTSFSYCFVGSNNPFAFDPTHNIIYAWTPTIWLVGVTMWNISAFILTFGTSFKT